MQLLSICYGLCGYRSIASLSYMCDMRLEYPWYGVYTFFGRGTHTHNIFVSTQGTQVSPTGFEMLWRIVIVNGCDERNGTVYRRVCVDAKILVLRVSLLSEEFHHQIKDRLFDRSCYRSPCCP